VIREKLNRKGVVCMSLVRELYFGKVKLYHGNHGFLTVPGKDDVFFHNTAVSGLLKQSDGSIEWYRSEIPPATHDEGDVLVFETAIENGGKVAYNWINYSSFLKMELVCRVLTVIDCQGKKELKVLYSGPFYEYVISLYFNHGPFSAQNEEIWVEILVRHTWVKCQYLYIVI
jgi:hypothetical protein